MSKKKKKTSESADKSVACNGEESLDTEVLAPEAANNGGITLTRTFMMGPLPPPSVLKAYDDVMPGLAERIINSWEAESSHRRRQEEREHELESEYLKKTILQSSVAMWMSFALCLIAIGGGMWAILQGMATEGVIAALGGMLVGIIAKFKGPSLNLHRTTQQEPKGPDDQPDSVK